MSDEGTIESGREKKPLSLKRQGRPEGNQPADAGQVRQSFSHGRSRSVAVEVRKKRNITQAGGISATPKQATEPPVKCLFFNSLMLSRSCAACSNSSARA